MLRSLFFAVACGGSLAAASLEMLRSEETGKAATALSRPSKLLWMASTEYCLCAGRHPIENPVRMHVDTCDADAWDREGRKYVLEDGRIRLYDFPEYCVTVDGEEHFIGAGIYLRPCFESNTHQTWSFSGRGQMMISKSAGQMQDLCLGIEGGSAFAEAMVSLQECGGAQEWIQLTQL